MKQAKAFLTGFKDGFRLFGRIVSGIINIILLSLVYFVGVGVTSLACKLRRKRFLELEIDRCRKSYWEESEISRRDKKDYSRMF